jgi:internalin A
VRLRAGRETDRRSIWRSIAQGAVAATLFGVAGCEKVPTWSELVNGKKETPATPAAAPVAKQAPPVAPAKPAPKPVEAPKKTAQEAIAEFNSTPVYRRTDAQLAELASFPEARDQVTNLDVQSSTISDAGLSVLPKFEHVETLNISTLNYSNAALAEVAKMKSVTTLYMAKGAQKDKNSDAGLESLKQMKQLVALHIDASKLTTAGIAAIAEMTQLETLSVAGVSQFADEHLKMLAPLVNLKYLDLTGSYVSDNGMPYLAPFTELETLKLAKMQAMHGPGFKELVMKRKGLPKIRNLTFYDNPYLSIEAYEGISRLKSLETLDVGSANCNNMAFTGAFPPLKNLVALNVHDNDGLSDPGMTVLPKIRSLKSIYFQDNKYVSDQSVPYFIKCKSLEALTLINTAVTPTGARKIKAKLKNCKINYNNTML